MKRYLSLIIVIVSVLLLTISVTGVSAQNNTISINVLLNTSITQEYLTHLSNYGGIQNVLVEINAVTMRAKASELPNIQALPYVAAANPDAERLGIPIDTVTIDEFSGGLSTWNLDAINVTDYGFDNRQVPYDGEGVYVAVLDTGLLDSWRQYLPEQRIATQYAMTFGGGGNEAGNISTQPNKWEHDTNSHGTHVTSTILGYNLRGTPINGVAPLAQVIPVKVLNNNGSGWSSVVAAGIVYVGDLKAGPLSDSPVVINMSLGGPTLDAVETAAINYAISQGVIIVASAGNGGADGMGYPGAYAPVISVAAAGWDRGFTAPSWWYALDVDEPTPLDQFYIANFSSRELDGQDLDVTAPGVYVVGPYQLQLGQTSYYYLSGTSMASPHVAGIAALMLQKNNTLVQSQVEGILEAAAKDMKQYGNVVWTHADQGEGFITADAALKKVHP